MLHQIHKKISTRKQFFGYFLLLFCVCQTKTSDTKCLSNITFDLMKTKCINDDKCSGFSWKMGNPPPTKASGCLKYNQEITEGSTWNDTHQYIRCDCKLKKYDQNSIFCFFNFRHNV